MADIVGDILTYCVQDLLEGHEYFFRVYAFNVFGSSEPLETADAVVVTKPFGASTGHKCLSRLRATTCVFLDLKLSFVKRFISH